MSEEQLSFGLAIEEPRFCGLLRLRTRFDRLFEELQGLVEKRRAEAWGFDAFEQVVELAEGVVDAQTWNTSWMRIRADRIFKLCKSDEAFFYSQREDGRRMARLTTMLADAADALVEAERFEIERMKAA